MSRVLPLAGLMALLLLTGCSGGSQGVEDLCALGHLPSRTPAEVQVLGQRVEAVMADHKGEAVAGGDARRVFLAAMKLQQAAYGAGALASADPPLASAFLAGSDVLTTDVAGAQRALRGACRG
jgi:hypothetical protein